ncbi:DNA polymerase/3'-5' exonuclease PolX [Patescibacteria group bacterium]|nr:DNA polymerase/3'-5' exonuclease PolX [Patescibacteria group bacterium]MBU1922038.1 DNA polymerase/3'-5' exonuclease PolX [Patescibacteria group bacterium]
MSNKQIVEIFYEISQILEAREVAFKPRAYARAGQAIESLGQEVADIYREGGEAALDAIPGVGKGLIEKLVELISTSKLKYLMDLKKKFPVDIVELTAIEGVGPKMVRDLYKYLKIKNLKDLERAARARKIAGLPGFQEKTEQNILAGIEFLKKGMGRVCLGFYLDLAEHIRDELRKTPGTTRVELAGSIRRGKETIKDFDLVACSSNPRALLEKFYSLPEVARVLERGKNRAFVRLKDKIDADLIVVPEHCFGSAILHFTGSKFHNVRLRKMAQERGWTLNEYGLAKGKKILASKTEREIYKKLGLDWIEPELREDAGEIEAAMARKLPKLMPMGSVRGDLQIQSDWSDGANSIEQMARAAKGMGFKYIAITDHTKTLAMANGLDERRLAKQGKEIDRLNRKIKNFKILKSAEINILKDGKLDIENSALRKLDIVSVAVHSHFNQDEKAMTGRIIKAMRNPYVNILFHPTGRIINRRPEYKVNIDEIIKAAKKYNVALELDCFPDRMDLKDTNVRKAIEAGVKIVIDTDAHQVGHLKYIPLGEATARRGWAQKLDVLNTLPAQKLMAYFSKKKHRRG